MKSILIFCILLIQLPFLNRASAFDKLSFWNEPQHGANSFNRLPPNQEYFNALKNYGATWVRLTYDKWKGENKDFLLGNTNHYKTLSAKDLTILMDTLDRANKAKLKVVISPLSLPYLRWSQNNGDQYDGQLWQKKSNWLLAAKFWQDLARNLKDHPAVIAYNLINEPTPEKNSGLKEHADLAAMNAWYKKHKGSARDIIAFYETIIQAIRVVDPKTPIMVDAGWYAAADAFNYWPSALSDNRVLYSFHMYEPYDATSGPNLRRKKPYQYPGNVPFANGVEYWDAKRVAKYLQQPINWAKTNNIPKSRLVAGEFGCVRQLPGCKTYLKDVLTFLDQENLHWAFYSFREDTWDAMDYELGTEKVHWKYWDAMEKGQPDPIKRQSTPLFKIIQNRL
ncbi:glycoside hydrolase family 5 protein [Zooshikella sp. RANM57]|uniref:glycoside hydrolase family 5 protein n=1 Tax=Zooshikella sp. RANM57 TaxID=3425863 RepID=UPI003D6E86D7